MTKFRKLTQNEKEVITNQIKKFQNKIDKFQTKIENIDFFVSRFLPMEYEEKMERYKESKKDLVEQINELQQNIMIMREQLVKGVEVKTWKKLNL